jgi:hypothetical protein
MPVIDIPLERTHASRHEHCRAMLAAQGVVGGGCDVAVIDTGVDPDWLETLARSHKTDIIAYDFTRNQEGWREPPGKSHGSRIIADILQSAPLARIHSLRVHGAEQGTSRADIVRAITWCGEHNIKAANLSAAFYGNACTAEAPCELCRTINSVALSSGLFTVIAAGDAYRVGQLLDRGEGIAQCPAARAELGWCIASPEVVTPGAELVKHPEGGLSFTTGKFTSGVAQLRGALPALDLFTIRRVIRRSCVPSAHVPAGIGGFGRHCFLMAWLAASGAAETASGRMPPLDLNALRRPSTPAKSGADRALLQALQAVCAGPVMAQQWREARDIMTHVLEAVTAWARPLDLALAHHVRAACQEALGEDAQAAADYDSGVAALMAGLGIAQ